jgi:ribonuclease HI
MLQTCLFNSIKMPYYAVARGRKNGIFSTWDDCKKQVIGFSGSIYKKFESATEANSFMRTHSTLSIEPAQVTPITSSQSSSFSSSGVLVGNGASNSISLFNNETLYPTSINSKKRLIPTSAGISSTAQVKKRKFSSQSTSASSRRFTSFESSSSNSSSGGDSSDVVSRSRDEPSNQLPSSATAGFKLFFDGGSRGNPGIAGAGAVLFAPDATTVLAEVSSYCGAYTSNNEAEYSGLIEGMKTALSLNVKELEVYGDSDLVIKQVLGIYRVSAPNLKPYHEQALKLRKKFDKFSIHHVFRSHNAKADQHANEAMDRKSSDVTIQTSEVLRKYNLSRT